MAPASSSCAFAFSASSLEAFSSTGLGAPSTRSLASFRPRLATIARTSLMTWIFLSPAALEDDVELVLLLGGLGGAAATGSRGRGDRDGSRGGHAELLFERLEEVVELEDGHVLEDVEQLCGAQGCHGVLFSLVTRCYSDSVAARRALRRRLGLGARRRRRRRRPRRPARPPRLPPSARPRRERRRPARRRRAPRRRARPRRRRRAGR